MKSLQELLTEMGKAAAYNCTCTMCSMRYCDDDLDKARRYRTDIPKLVRAMQVALATLTVYASVEHKNDFGNFEVKVRFSEPLAKSALEEIVNVLEASKEIPQSDPTA